MDIFAPDITFDPSQRTSQNGAAVRMDSFNTTLSQTRQNVFDPNGIPRSPQQDDLSTSLGSGAVAPFEGGIGIGAYASSLANACTAVGYHSTAKVYSSIALGDQAQALAYRSIAIGRCANATGTNSIAIGTLAKVSGGNSISIGNAAISTSTDDIVFGDGASATGDSSVVIGRSALSTGNRTVAIGNGCATTADDAVSMGSNCTVSGSQSIAIGSNSSTQFSNTITFGFGAQPLAVNQFVAGSAGSGMSDVWFGQGPRVGLQSGTIAAWTLHGEEAGGGTSGDGLHNLNKAGGVLNLAGGRSTGSATGGAVNIQISGSGAGSETLNALVTQLTVTSTAVTAPTADFIATAGSVGALAGHIYAKTYAQINDGIVFLGSGATASDILLKKTGTRLDIRLGDDSGDADIAAGTHYVSGTLIFQTTKTVTNGNVGGDLTITEMFTGTSYKAIIIRLRNFSLTASYTFSGAFVDTPLKIESTAGLVSALSTTAVTITTAGLTNGWVKLEGF